MAIPNRISATIPEAVIAEVITKIKEAQALLLPHLVNTLTSEDVAGLAKLGEKSEPFVTKGLEYAKTNGGFVPTWVDIPEANKDFVYFNALRPIDILLAQLAGQVADSRIEAGAEALDAVNDFYKTVQQANKSGLAAALPIYNDLKERYASYGKKATKTDSPK